MSTMYRLGESPIPGAYLWHEPVKTRQNYPLALLRPVLTRNFIYLTYTSSVLNKEARAYRISDIQPRARRGDANNGFIERVRYEVEPNSNRVNDVEYFGTSGDRAATFRAENKVAKEVPEDDLSEIFAMMKARRRQTKISKIGEENMLLLLSIGASRKQVCYLFKKHIVNMNLRPAAPVLLASIRAFQGCGLDRQTFLHVLLKVSRGRPSSWFLFQSPAGLMERLEFLEGLVVKNCLAGVIRTVPDTLTLPPGSLEERVQTLREIGVRLDKRVLVSFPAILRREPDAVRATAAAMQDTLGPSFSMKGRNPVLLTLKAEAVEVRADAFRALVGDTPLADRILSSCPELFVSKTETVYETWHKLGERLGFDSLSYVATAYPYILALSWRNVGPTFDYLVDVVKLDPTEVLKNPGLLGFSLHRRIKPRLEFLMATGGLRGLSLVSILKPNRAAFAKRFGSKLSVSGELSDEVLSDRYESEDLEEEFTSL